MSCSDQKCLAEESSQENVMCPQDGTKGKPIPTKTLWYMVKGKYQMDVKNDLTYFFCPSARCDVVYFSTNNHFFTTDQIRISVGQKAKENPQLCYCFNFFESDLRDEIETTKEIAMLDFIRQKIKAKACSCEIMNPQGSCCLGNVSQAAKRILKSKEVES